MWNVGIQIPTIATTGTGSKIPPGRGSLPLSPFDAPVNLPCVSHYRDFSCSPHRDGGRYATPHRDITGVSDYSLSPPGTRRLPNNEVTPPARPLFASRTLPPPRPHFHPYHRPSPRPLEPLAHSHQPGIERDISRYILPRTDSLFGDCTLPPLRPRLPHSRPCPLPPLSELFPPIRPRCVEKRISSSNSALPTYRSSIVRSPEGSTLDQARRPHRLPPSYIAQGQYNPSQKKPTRQIRCGWVGCGVQLEYNEAAISEHAASHWAQLEETQKEAIEMRSCRWILPNGVECGTEIQRRNFRRHIVGIHTTLLNTVCAWCSKDQRKDALNRHQRLYCKKRPKNLGPRVAKEITHSSGDGGSR